MPKKRILIVDDEPGFTRLLKLSLEKMGAYEVGEEHRGARALATARAFRPDLILLDVIMPEVDGSEVLTQLQADASLKEVPVVFLTGVMSRAEALAEPRDTISGHPYIVKPSSAHEVIASIERYLRR